jgi:hypothetical protein
MKKTFLLISLLLLGVSLHSKQIDAISSPFCQDQIVSEDDFSILYKDGISFFMTNKYDQALTTFTFILNSENASENIKGAALWGRVWANACLGRNEDLIRDLDTIVDFIRFE